MEKVSIPDDETRPVRSRPARSLPCRAHFGGAEIVHKAWCMLRETPRSPPAPL